jgi:N-carbamoyl-L-amino-acid hydrolase
VPNIVPGLCAWWWNCAISRRRKIARLAEKLRTRTREIAAKTRTEIDMRAAAHHEEALATPEVQKSIEAACGRLGLKSQRLPSGAGHDAQMMALLGPME